MSVVLEVQAEARAARFEAEVAVEAVGVVLGRGALVPALELDFVAAGFAGEAQALFDQRPAPEPRTEASVTMFSTCAQGCELWVRLGTITRVTVPMTGPGFGFGDEERDTLALRDSLERIRGLRAVGAAVAIAELLIDTQKGVEVGRVGEPDRGA